MLGMGDAMAVFYEHLEGLSPEQFRYQPSGGLLGKSLRMKVGDILLGRELVPIVEQGSEHEKCHYRDDPLSRRGLCHFGWRGAHGGDDCGGRYSQGL